VANSKISFCRPESKRLLTSCTAPSFPPGLNCSRAEDARAWAMVRAGRPWPASKGVQFRAELQVQLTIDGECDAGQIVFVDALANGVSSGVVRLRIAGQHAVSRQHLQSQS
jgi:hypothetical protein